MAGRFVAGRFVEGRFVGVPFLMIHHCREKMSLLTDIALGTLEPLSLQVVIFLTVRST